MTEWITTSDARPDRVMTKWAPATPAIIFVHGGFGARGGFELQEEYFVSNHRCISLDLRGHGESDRPETWTMADHGDDVAELIRQLNLVKPILVGQSMGGTGGHLGRRPPSRRSGGDRQPGFAQATSPAGPSAFTVPTTT